MNFTPRSSSSDPSRRRFVQAAGGLAATLAAASARAQSVVPRIIAQQEESERLAASPEESLIRPGDVILFQGDSITDAGRKKDSAAANDQPALGNGYAWLAASELLVDRPDGNLKIFNRGISGNKVYQLAERWDADCLALKPDVLSILIGVNDFWHKHKHGYDGTLEKYETDYRALIRRTRDALPDVRLVICEPFVLKTGAVDDGWFPEFDGYRAAARKVADEAKAAFVPFQAMFDAAAKLAPANRWLGDGVHPAPDGAALMAHEWLKAVGA
jgi:lysophospholipase L1-like esterase